MRKVAKLRPWVFVSIIAATVVSLSIITTSSYNVAAISLSGTASDAIITKAMLAGVQHCISDTYLLSETYIGEHDLITKSNFAAVLFTDVGRKEDEDSVKLPTRIGNSLNDSAAGCSELFLGYNGIGDNDLDGFSVAVNTKAAAKWAEALGYEKSTSPELNNSDSSVKCVSMKYKMTVGSSLQSFQTNELCFEVDDKGEVLRENNQIRVMEGIKDTATSGNILTFEQMGGSNVVQFTTNCTYIGGGLFGGSWFGSPQTCYQSTISYPNGLYDNLNILDMKTYFATDPFSNRDINNKGICIEGASERYCRTYADVQSPEIIIRDETTGDSTTEISNYYKLSLSGTGRLATVKNNAVKFFSNGKYENAEAAKFDNIDRYNDYTYTLFNLFGIKTDSGLGCASDKKDMANQDLAIKMLAKDGSDIWVHLDSGTLESAKSKQLIKNVNGKSNKDVKGMAYVIMGTRPNNAITSNRDSITPIPMSIETIIEFLNDLDMSGLDVSSLTAVNADSCIVDGVADMPTTYDPETPVDDPNGDDVSGTSCYTSTSLGWILCPILDLVNGAVQSMYGLVEGELEIAPNLVGSSEDNSGTFDGWSIFQNIANTIIIIMLLIIIFSQVTGIGIDNYGIKKTLPKLVIAAVLVNISFIICQVSADISNILGVNLKDMFVGLAGGTVNEYVKVDGFTKLVSTSLSLGAAAGLGVAAYFTWELWIIPLLLGLVGLLISILFFFILLEVRKALIIVFIVLSPVAIARYMLPNTKKWFDKWVKVFGAMLLVFPICGLAMGAGTYISQLLIRASGGEGGFLFYLVAVLMNVIPFFFIPMLLKNSMAGLGNIGAKVSGLGKGLGSKVKGAAGNSERAKDAQRRLNMSRNQKIFDRYQRREQAGKSLSGYQRRRMNNARLAYNNAAREDIAAAAGGEFLAEGTTAYNAAMAMQESATNKQALENEVALMADETGNYEIGAMNAQLQELLAKNSLSEKDEIRMKALMYQMAKGSGFHKKTLAKTLGSDKISHTARAAAAKFMSKNGEVSAAINGKDLAMGQYLREVNIAAVRDQQAGVQIGAAGSEVSKIGDFSTWAAAARMENGAPTGMTNMQFVTSNVATKDEDFVGQSASAVQASVGTLSDDRLSRLVQNERVMDLADDDVRSAIIAEAKARNNIAVPVKYSGASAPVEVAPNINPTVPVTPINPTELNVQGGASGSSRTVDVKIEQPAQRVNVEQAVERMNGGSRERMQTDSGIILNESPEVQRQLEREFRQKKDEADRKNGRNGGGIILPS